MVAGNPAKYIRRIESKTNKHHKPELDDQKDKGLKQMANYANTGWKTRSEYTNLWEYK